MEETSGMVSLFEAARFSQTRGRDAAKATEREKMFTGWREYSRSEVPYFQGLYQAVSIRGITVVAVGFLNSAQAITIVGRR